MSDQISLRVSRSGELEVGEIKFHYSRPNVRIRGVSDQILLESGACERSTFVSIGRVGGASDKLS